jgi:hypothetical protein
MESPSRPPWNVPWRLFLFGCEAVVEVEGAGRGARRKSRSRVQVAQRERRRRREWSESLRKLRRGLHGRGTLKAWDAKASGYFLVLRLVGTDSGTWGGRAPHTAGGQCTPMRAAGLFGGLEARWRGLAAQNLQQVWVTKAQDGGHV